MKKYIRACILTLAILTLFAVSASAAEILDSGTCGAEGDGSNLTWTIDSEGMLTIEGNGAMADYYYLSAPWRNYYLDIKSVTFRAGVTSIGNTTFESCRSLTSVTIPDGVTRIGNSAFSDCGSLKSVVIPESVTSIGKYAFSGCSSLTSVTIPDGVMKIGDSLFCCCGSLTSVIIPETVTSIGDHAFFNCNSLTSVIIPNCVTSIGIQTFYNCSLTSVIIPSSVTSIDYYAFKNCTCLKNVYYAGSEKSWQEIDIEAGNDCLTNATIHYLSPALSVSASSTSSGGVAYTVKAENIPVSSVVIVALYDGGRFVGCEKAFYQGEDLVIETTTAHDSAKVMAWKDLQSAKPVVRAVKC